MPRVTTEAPHTLGREEAVRRLKDKFSMVQAAYGAQVSDLHEQWTDSTFSFGFRAMGMKVSGTLEVEDSQVRLAVDLPLAAMMFKGKIQQQVRAELDALLG
jgi:hypothetical protein